MLEQTGEVRHDRSINTHYGRMEKKKGFPIQKFSRFSLPVRLDGSGQGRILEWPLRATGGKKAMIR